MSIGSVSISIECINFIKSILPIGSTILELGSGQGTVELSKWFKMYSVENQFEWVHKFPDCTTYIPCRTLTYDDTFTAPNIAGTQTAWYHPDDLFENLPKSYDLILKIHTKLCVGSEKNKSYHLQRFGLEETKKYGLKWFSELMDGVLLDTKKIERIINEFEQNPKCGMVGYKKYNNFKKTSDHIQKLFDYFSFSVNPHDSYFVGGTIFWVKKNVLDQYLTHEKIDHVLNLLDKGYSYEPSFAHAMERMFGYFIYDQKKELIVIN